MPRPSQSLGARNDERKLSPVIAKTELPPVIARRESATDEAIYSFVFFIFAIVDVVDLPRTSGIRFTTPPYDFTKAAPTISLTV